MEPPTPKRQPPSPLSTEPSGTCLQTIKELPLRTPSALRSQDQKEAGPPFLYLSLSLSWHRDTPDDVMPRGTAPQAWACKGKALLWVPAAHLDLHGHHCHACPWPRAHVTHAPCSTTFTDRQPPEDLPCHQCQFTLSALSAATTLSPGQ